MINGWAEINAKEFITDSVIDALEVVEAHLQAKIDEFEKNGGHPVLTRTDILLFFSKVYDSLKEIKDESKQ